MLEYGKHHESFIFVGKWRSFSTICVPIGQYEFRTVHWCENNRRLEGIVSALIIERIKMKKLISNLLLDVSYPSAIWLEILSKCWMVVSDRNRMVQAKFWTGNIMIVWLVLLIGWQERKKWNILLAFCANSWDSSYFIVLSCFWYVIT